MTIEISPKKVIRVLGGVLALLMAANVAVLISTYVFGHGTVKGIVPLFDFDTDGNVPNYFSALLLLLGGLLFLATSAASRKPGTRDHLYWRVLGFIFLYLSLDEAVRFHERLILPIQRAIGASGFLFFAWVIPYGIAVVVLGLIYLRFLRRLPPRFRWMLIAAGVIYVSGAFGMELIGGKYYDLHNGEKDIIYALITFIEETLEPIGIITLIHALLTHLQTTMGSLRLEFEGLTGPVKQTQTQEVAELESVASQAMTSAR